MGLLGKVLASGIAGGAKGFSDAYAEYAKQEAMSLREQNMMRIQALYRKEEMESTQKFQKEENALTRGLTASEGKAGRDLTASEGKATRAVTTGEGEKTRELQKTLHDKAETAAQSRLEQSLSATAGAQESAQAHARTMQKEGGEIAKANQEALLKLADQLKDNDKNDVEKTFDFLVKHGDTTADALATVKSVITKERDLDRQKLLAAAYASYAAKNPDATDEQENKFLTSLKSLLGLGKEAGKGKDLSAKALLERSAPADTKKPGSGGLLNTEPEKPKIMGKSAMGLSLPGVFGPVGAERKKRLDEERAAGTISEKAYRKAVLEAEEQEKL
jgi:hypothetical protein